MLKRISGALRYRWKRMTGKRLRRVLGEQVRALDDSGYTLLSNNCLAGQLYEMAEIRKSSPTVGLFFSGDSYVRFLDAVASEAADDWARIDVYKLTTDQARQCPVLALDEGSTVFFLHYPDPELAAEKWNSRFPRMAERRKIVIASLRDVLKESMLSNTRRSYRHFFVLGPEPALPADEAVLDLDVLSQLSEFLGNVLAKDD